MPRSVTYTFKYVEKCNMCGSDSRKHKVMGKRLNQAQGKNAMHKVGITTTVMQCTDCNLIYTNPMPVPASISDHYGVPPEEYWNADFFTTDEKEFAPEIKTLSTLMKINPDSRSLDIGAGIGKNMIALEKAGFDSFGLEPSEPFYKRAIEKMGVKPEKIKLSSVEEAKYIENYFDFISFGAVLEHLYDPSEAIERTLSWLKPGGIIHIEVPSSKWAINRLVNFYYKINGTDYVANLSPMHVPYHLYEFDLESFYKNSEKNKYEIVAHEYFVCSTFMPKIFDSVFKRYMRKTNTGMQLTVWLRKK